MVGCTTVQEYLQTNGDTEFGAALVANDWVEDPIVTAGDEANWSDRDSLDGNDAEGLCWFKH